MIEKLLALQEEDVRIREIEKELSDIPLRKGIEEARLEEHKQALQKAEDALKAKQAEVKEQELEVETARGQITKLRQQQMTLKTNKEFKAIESEVETLDASIAGIEDRELVLMDDVESLTHAVHEQKESLAREAAGVKQDVSAWDDRAKRLESDLAELRERRATRAATIEDEEWLARYERVMTRRDRAIVPVEDGVCGGCHLQCPPYIIHDAKKQASMVSCNFCGRILY